MHADAWRLLWNVCERLIEEADVFITALLSH